MSVHGDDFMVLGDDLGLEHVDKLLAGNHTAKNLGTLGFEEGCASELQLLNRGIRCGLGDRGEYIDIEKEYIHHVKISVQ